MIGLQVGLWTTEVPTGRSIQIT